MQRRPAGLQSKAALSVDDEMELILALKRENEKLSQLYGALQKEQQRLKTQILSQRHKE